MKTLKLYLLSSLMLAFCAVACGEIELEDSSDHTAGTPETEATVLTAEIAGSSKTVLGDKTGNNYKVGWSDSDRINVNGSESAEAVLFGEGAASFSFTEELTAPFRAVYPASAYRSCEGAVVTVSFPSLQQWTEASFDPSSALMYASSDEDTKLVFHHLAAYLKLSFSTESDPDNIRSLILKARGTESMSGDFTLDLAADSPQLVFVSENAAGISVDCPEEGIAAGTEVIVAIPAQTYSSGIEIVTTDVNGDETTHLLKNEFNAAAGTVYTMPISFELYPGSRMKPITVRETVDGVQKDVVWAPVYCGYSTEHPNGLLYQYGRAVGQPYYPASKSSSICVAGPVQDPVDGNFYKSAGDWYSGTAFIFWPEKEGDAGYVAGKIGNPCPNGWRLPTVAEVQGLLDIGFSLSAASGWNFNPSGDDAKKETVYVHLGFNLNDDSGLFLSAVGGRIGSSGQSYYRGNTDGYARLWCSDIVSGTEATKASVLNLRKTSGGLTQEISAQLRANGFPVRCVKNNNQ